MKFENINKIICEAENRSYSKLLFDFKFGNIVLKCLLIVESRILMISIKKYSVGHRISFGKNGDFSGSLPKDFLKVVIDEILNTYNEKKVTLMWNDLDNHLLHLNIDKIAEVNNSDIISILRTQKTIDKNFDPDGDKPFFETWVRHKIKGYSKENIKKTESYFGYPIANLCKEHNISSRWNAQPQNDSLDFLNLKKAENDIKNKINMPYCT
jgi:hypothetical protein